MRKLELLNPCDFTPEYGAPTPDPNVLLCRGCGHTVRDLSAMTEAEALAFLERRRPDECVQFRTDASERVRFADGTGSLIGRIARDARPMIAVASLALAACGDGQRVAPSHPSLSELLESSNNAAPAPDAAPVPGERRHAPSDTPADIATADTAHAATTAPQPPAAPRAEPELVVPPFPGPPPPPRTKKSITAPAPTAANLPRDFRMVGR